MGASLPSTLQFLVCIGFARLPQRENSVKPLFFVGLCYTLRCLPWKSSKFYHKARNLLTDNRLLQP